jgi:predicted GNAT superfamily acetyltransferase
MNVAVTAETLGFVPSGPRRWRKEIRGHTIEFRELRQLDELGVAERLQRDVMKLSMEDTVRASFLIIAPDTGGFVIGAFEGKRELSVAFGYGGYLHPEPFLHSDFLAVIPEAQSIGIGFEMKRLQAALALERGYESIRWTVDPLRAANARLNYERLGALGIKYTRNKYGSDFGAGLYGGMPTDRLLLRWPLRTERTAERLIGDYIPRPVSSLDGLEEVAAKSIGSPQLVISIPSDIDHLVKTDFDRAMRYRIETREKVELALEAGYFVAGAARGGEGSRLLLEPAAMFEEPGESA